MTNPYVPDKNKALVVALRHAILIMLSAVEKWLDISPTTAEIRSVYKKDKDEDKLGS